MARRATRGVGVSVLVEVRGLSDADFVDIGVIGESEGARTAEDGELLLLEVASRRGLRSGRGGGLATILEGPNADVNGGYAAAGSTGVLDSDLRNGVKELTVLVIWNVGIDGEPVGEDKFRDIRSGSTGAAVAESSMANVPLPTGRGG